MIGVICLACQAKENRFSHEEFMRDLDKQLKEAGW